MNLTACRFCNVISYFYCIHLRNTSKDKHSGSLFISLCDVLLCCCGLNQASIFWADSQQSSNFIKIRAMGGGGAELFNMDRRTDMTKLIVAFLKGVGRYLRHDHSFHGIENNMYSKHFDKKGTHMDGARGGVVFKALRYKSAGRGFDSRWCHWNFSVT